MSKAPRTFMPAYMDAGTLAYALSLSPRTIEVWVERGLLPRPLETGGKRLWSWRAVEEAMERLTAEGAEKAAIASITEAVKKRHAPP